MTRRNYAILCYATGFAGMWLLLTAASWLILRPFGVGYIGAELMSGYLAWSTAYRWDYVNAHLEGMLQEHDL